MPKDASSPTSSNADFIVEEDGVAQPITQFTKERVPVSLSLTLDISDSMRGQRMADARGALAHFLDKLLAVDDEASLLGFNHETRMFGAVDDASAPGMRAKLDAIRPSGGTALYDADRCGAAAVRIAPASARGAAARVRRRRYRQRHDADRAEAEAGAQRRVSLRDRHRLARRAQLDAHQSVHAATS